MLLFLSCFLSFLSFWVIYLCIYLPLFIIKYIMYLRTEILLYNTCVCIFILLIGMCVYVCICMYVGLLGLWWKGWELGELPVFVMLRLIVFIYCSLYCFMFCVGPPWKRDAASQGAILPSIHFFKDVFHSNEFRTKQRKRKRQSISKRSFMNKSQNAYLCLISALFVLPAAFFTHQISLIAVD